MITTYLTIHASTVFLTFAVLLGTSVLGFAAGEFFGRTQKVKPVWIPAILFGIALVAFVILAVLL